MALLFWPNQWSSHLNVASRFLSIHQRLHRRWRGCSGNSTWIISCCRCPETALRWHASSSSFDTQEAVVPSSPETFTLDIAGDRDVLTLLSNYRFHQHRWCHVLHVQYWSQYFCKRLKKNVFNIFRRNLLLSGCHTSALQWMEHSSS